MPSIIYPCSKLSFQGCVIDRSEFCTLSWGTPMKQNVVATLFLVNIKSRMQFIIHQWRWSQRFWFANPNGDFCSCRGGMQGPCRHWLFRLNFVWLELHLAVLERKQIRVNNIVLFNLVLVAKQWQSFPLLKNQLWSFVLLTIQSRSFMSSVIQSSNYCILSLSFKQKLTSNKRMQQNKAKTHNPL